MSELDQEGTPRPGDPRDPATDPDTERNPVTPPNPAETPAGDGGRPPE